MRAVIFFILFTSLPSVVFSAAAIQSGVNLANQLNAQATPEYTAGVERALEIYNQNNSRTAPDTVSTLNNDMQAALAKGMSAVDGTGSSMDSIVGVQLQSAVLSAYVADTLNANGNTGKCTQFDYREFCERATFSGMLQASNTSSGLPSAVVNSAAQCAAVIPSVPVGFDALVQPSSLNLSLASTSTTFTGDLNCDYNSQNVLVVNNTGLNIVLDPVVTPWLTVSPKTTYVNITPKTGATTSSGNSTVSAAEAIAARAWGTWSNIASACKVYEGSQGVFRSGSARYSVFAWQDLCLSKWCNLAYWIRLSVSCRFSSGTKTNTAISDPAGADAWALTWCSSNASSIQTATAGKVTGIDAATGAVTGINCSYVNAINATFTIPLVNEPIQPNELAMCKADPRAWGTTVTAANLVGTYNAYTQCEWSVALRDNSKCNGFGVDYSVLSTYPTVTPTVAFAPPPAFITNSTIYEGVVMQNLQDDCAGRVVPTMITNETCILNGSITAPVSTLPPITYSPMEWCAKNEIVYTQKASDWRLTPEYAALLAGGNQYSESFDSGCVNGHICSTEIPQPPETVQVVSESSRSVEQLSCHVFEDHVDVSAYNCSLGGSAGSPVDIYNVPGGKSYGREWYNTSTFGVCHGGNGTTERAAGVTKAYRLEIEPMCSSSTTSYFAIKIVYGATTSSIPIASVVKGETKRFSRTVGGVLFDFEITASVDGTYKVFAGGVRNYHWFEPTLTAYPGKVNHYTSNLYAVESFTFISATPDPLKYGLAGIEVASNLRTIYYRYIAHDGVSPDILREYRPDTLKNDEVIVMNSKIVGSGKKKKEVISWFKTPSKYYAGNLGGKCHKFGGVVQPTVFTSPGSNVERAYVEKINTVINDQCSTVTGATLVSGPTCQASAVDIFGTSYCTDKIKVFAQTNETTVEIFHQ